jgi:hypothetical protein
MLSLEDFLRNLLLLWPVLGGLIAYVAIASAVLWSFEHAQRLTHVASYADAVYYTWLTMCTVGNADPATPGGKVITSADVLAGLLLIGVFVWVVTTSLNQRELKLAMTRGLIPPGPWSRRELRDKIFAASAPTDSPST